MLNEYLAIKAVHVISSMLLVGTGFGSAFYLFMANRQADWRVREFVGRRVERADWYFTLPAVLLQPATGVWLTQLAGWPLTTPWLLVSMILYAVVGACWIPVVVIQIRMHRLAGRIARGESDDAARYARWARQWECLGYVGFSGACLIILLMVIKPALW